MDQADMGVLYPFSGEEAENRYLTDNSTRAASKRLAMIVRSSTPLATSITISAESTAVIVYALGTPYFCPVFRSCRQRRAAIRLLILAALALSLLLRPILSSLGEIHELAHDPGGQHLDIGTFAETTAGHAAEEQPEGKGAGTLHALLHFAHCCGHASAAFPGFALEPVRLTAADHLMDNADAAIPRARWQAPFRPPISA